MRVASRTLGAGCPACGPRAAAIARRGKRAPMHQRSLAVLRPDLVAELHPSRNPGLDAERVGVWSKRKVWWRCGTGATDWQALIMTRQQGSGCPKCAQQRRRATYQRIQAPNNVAAVSLSEPSESENAEHSTG